MQNCWIYKHLRHLQGKQDRGTVVIAWKLDLQLPVKSVTITTYFVSSIPTHGEVYLIQHFVHKFISDLRQVGGFCRVLRFPPPIEVTVTIYSVFEILLKVALSIITQHKIARRKQMKWRLEVIQISSERINYLSSREI